MIFTSVDKKDRKRHHGSLKRWCTLYTNFEWGGGEFKGPIDHVLVIFISDLFVNILLLICLFIVEPIHQSLLTVFRGFGGRGIRNM